MARPAHIPHTYRDYLALPDDGKRYELIGGDFYVSPSPTARHQTVSRRLQYALMTQLELPGIAWVFNAPMDVVLGDHDVLQPDIIVVRCGRRDLIDKVIRGTPDLVVEILSPSTSDRDRHLKREAYARHAVPEYWIVDPKQGSVELYTLDEAGYSVTATLDRDDVLTSPSFELVSIPLAPIFEPL